MTKTATLTITMDLGEASGADPARAAGALEALVDRLISGRFDGNFDHVVYDAKGPLYYAAPDHGPLSYKTVMQLARPS